jgi:tripartite-type tricarboxylate transporter receptor subunit TctC
MDRRTFLAGATAIGVGVAAGDRALGQSFPSNVIRIIVPYSASTPPDILARIIATALAEGEGWNVIVENKPGAVMTIGVTEVLKQPADGYTLLSITAPFAAVPALVPDAKFTIESDLTPLVQIGTAYNVLVVNPSVPVNSVAELIAYLKKDPGKYTFSSGGFGTPRTCSANCSSWRPACRRRTCPMSSFLRRSGTCSVGSTPTSSSPFCRSCSTSTRASCARWR